jgi:predicted nucleotidyltransferase
MLTEAERDCLDRYCARLAERLPDLVAVRMFGSAARGDMWPAHSPMHSDIDLLVVTRGDVGEDVREDLVNETYPLYLECGRQLSPAFMSEARLAEPGEAAELVTRVAAEGVDVWSSR